MPVAGKERQRQWRLKRAAEGLTPINIMVPVEYRAEFLAMAKAIEREPGCTIVGIAIRNSKGQYATIPIV